MQFKYTKAMASTINIRFHVYGTIFPNKTVVMG